LKLINGRRNINISSLVFRAARQTGRRIERSLAKIMFITSFFSRKEKYGSQKYPKGKTQDSSYKYFIRILYKRCISVM